MMLRGFGRRTPSETMRVSLNKFLKHAGNIGVLTVSYMCMECKRLSKDDVVWFASVRKKSFKRMTGVECEFRRNMQQ